MYKADTLKNSAVGIRPLIDKMLISTMADKVEVFTHAEMNQIVLFYLQTIDLILEIETRESFKEM